jgi:hypothetical protein
MKNPAKKRDFVIILNKVSTQTAKLSPQPQVRLALGLLK